MTILVRRPAGRAENPDQVPGAERGSKPPKLRAPFCPWDPARCGASLLHDYHVSVATLWRRYSSVVAVAGAAILMAACANETARAPVPTAYDWPDSLTYSISLETRAYQGAAIVAVSDETMRLRFAARDDGSFAVWHDSVRRTVRGRGAASVAVPPATGDTLHYFVRLSRWGEFLGIERGCDPAEAACHAVPPSALPLELRHLMPRLPVWWPPKGHEWADTLAFDDSPRPDGARGTVTTVYRAARDTALGGGSYWIVTWRAVRQAVRSAGGGNGGGGGGGAYVAEAEVEESGVVYVDKRRLVPALAVWQGTAVPAAELRSLGASRTEVRGRAVLAGSPLASLRSTEEAR